jgi:glyoxylase-like metal-dependent hydrolase (beta-lactamase superfamily II)
MNRQILQGVRQVLFPRAGGTPGGTEALLGAVRDHGTPLGRALVPYVELALPSKLPPAPVHETLVDGATLGPFRVVATPGHTAGHVSLLWAQRRVLFTGDAAAHITGLGPHPAADDPSLARETFRRLAELDAEAACFGHGRPIAPGAAAAFRHAASWVPRDVERLRAAPRSVPPVELVLGRPSGSTMGDRLVARRHVALAIAKRLAGEHDDVLVG